MEVTFRINGKLFSANSTFVPIDTTLNSFIRNHAKLTGTKFMCLEGGCGACIVTLCGIHPVTKEKHSWAVNSCLQNVYSCNGLDITTVEGIGNKREGMHKIQKCLANLNGTQCGYCSPGMVMNMYSLMESKDNQVTMKDVENSFGGNICRCTGYRPILDAFKSLALDATQELINKCNDIEDLAKGQICKKTGVACTNQCGTLNFTKKAIQVKFENNCEWHIVFNFEQLSKIVKTIKQSAYTFVAGNTAHGVYRRSPDLKDFIDISNVEELRSYKINQNSLELGANMTLSECMNLFTKVADDNKNFSYLHEVVSHFDLIANVPVRENGTLAGNLMIKNQHHEFPSDVFLIFETIGAVFKITNGASCAFPFIGTSSDLSPIDFITTDMDKKLMTKITIPAYNSKKFVFRSYKIMPRAQNAHAYVNAAFLLEMNKTKVITARICFGGINPDFVHAEKTEKFLVGQDLFKNETLQQALSTLSDEINPDWVLPDASPEYRKNLALSLFYKFVLNIAPNEKVSENFRSGGEILKRGLSSGTQTFDTYEKNWPMTKNIPKIEADAQCTGEAQYVNDIPYIPNELYAAFVTAKNVHGIIKDIDASEALKLPGVVAFFSAKDIPGTNTFMPKNYLFVVEPEEIFCESKVLFYNQPVGIIVAERFELAQYAAKLVVISYAENDVKDDPTRTKILPEYCKEATKSSVEKGQLITGKFEIGAQYHYHLETQLCVCTPAEDGINVYSPTQWMDSIQIAVAEALNMSVNQVNMSVRRLGGGFGGKISRPGQLACACALATIILKKPVRLILTIEDNMNIIGKRYPLINDYSVEVNKDGKILKLENEYVEDYGCCYNEPAYLTTGFFRNCYDDSVYKVIAKAAKTDTASNTWCRGPGTLEGIVMIENIMEHISRVLKKEPVDVRIKNIPDDIPMKQYLIDFVVSTDYYKRKLDIEKFNSDNRWIKRGIAIVPMRFYIEYFGSLHAFVSIYHRDGSVSVTVGGIEMGQGLNTKVAQTVAHILGVPLNKIIIKPSSTLTAPNAIVTGGSIGSEISCFAAQKACEILKGRLKVIKDEDSNLDWDGLIKKAYGKDVDLAASYMYKATDVENYSLYGATCCEMEVDLLSGNILIKRVDIMEDVGESISPGIDIGQIEGGFVMGLGYWLTESLVYDPVTGELLTNRTWNYKPPGAKDIPIDFRINFLNKSTNPFGVLRSKAIGEPPLCMSVVVLFALRHALDSARKDSGIVEDEYYDLGAPTCEKIFLVGNTKHEAFCFS
ncbi:xanthine dehydrogenase-like [Chironomus tepperi]|uniref:xanthine dehydrogenase-like n=1 Tax=Chironomus tepperi TaxID=113505 RepID=UPI00391F3C0F